MNKIIYHITTKTSWENAQKQTAYKADSLATEGFIHCSTQAQLIRTANRFFAGKINLIVLCINPEKVKSPIKYEPADNDLFPHIYGELNIDAVSQIVDLEADEKGLFIMPDINV